MSYRHILTVPALAAGLLFAAGCNAPSSTSSAKTAKAADGKEPHPHGHAHEGPHHGALVEWGDDEYHAEFTADRAKNEVVVYILGKDAKTALPIKADKVTLSLADPVTTVELKPVPQDGDPAGSASRFVGQIPAAFKGRKLSGTISGEVEGKPYAGDFKEVPAHDHDHDHDKGKK